MVDALAGGPPVAAQRDCHAVTVTGGDWVGKPISIGRRSLIFGRGADADVRFSDSGLSERHAQFSRNGAAIQVRDLRSADGTFVNDERVVEPRILVDGDQVRLGAHRVLRYSLRSRQEESAAHELYEATVRDVTTGAYGRRHFDELLRQEESYAADNAQVLSLLMFDIDQFKRINDAFGHVVGDGVLRVVAASVQRLLRPKDAVIRYGGDEFVVVCPNTSLGNAVILGKRICATIASLALSAAGHDFGVTVSVGVASTIETPPNDTLVATADQALLLAKRGGRNRVATVPKVSGTG